MESEPTDPASEEFSVRLSWPTAPVEEEPEPEPEPVAAPTPPAPSPERSSGRTSRRASGTVRTTVRTATVRTGAASPAATPVTADPPARATEPALRRPVPAFPPAPAPAPAPVPTSIGATVGDVGSSATARPFIDAFDRLSERLLDRLRALRQDIDADLTALRAEVGALRQALDEAGQGPQVRQVQLTLDETRSEVAALRRAVLEWPELERVSDEVSSMRGELSVLLEASDDPRHPSSLVGELRDVLDQVSDQLGARRSAESTGGSDPLSWLVDEVASIRSELSALGRTTEAVRLDPEQAERLVEAVSARVLDDLEARNRRTKRR